MSKSPHTPEFRAKVSQEYLDLAFRQGIAYNKEYINKKRNGTNERSIAQRAVSKHG